MQWLDNDEAMQRCSLTLCHMPPNPSAFLTEMLRGWEDIASPPVRFLPCHAVPAKAVWIHKSYLLDGFQAREILVSGNPKEIRRLLKLTTSTERDTIKCEDQLREIKRWPLAYLCLRCTGVTAAIYAICYPTYMKTYGLVTPAHPIQSKVFPPKHGRASPTKPQPGQFGSYQEQIPPAAPVSPSPKPPLTLCNQLPQNLSLFRTWSCTKRASILYIYIYI